MLFPSSPEVDRFISALYGKTAQSASLAFPSPLEVDRFISGDVGLTFYQNNQFPSPPEVIRFISNKRFENLSRKVIVSVPSRGI